MYKKSEKVKLIVKGMKEGKSLYRAIIEAGVKSHATLIQWRRNDPRIDRVIKAAEQLCLAKRIGMVTDANFESAINGNVAAQCFFLKNKAGWVDSPLIDQSQHFHLTYGYRVNTGSIRTKERESLPAKQDTTESP